MEITVRVGESSKGACYALTDVSGYGDTYSKDTDDYAFAKVGAVAQENELKEAHPIDMTGMNVQQFYDAVFNELARLAA